MYKKFGKNAEGAITIKPVIPITLKKGRQSVQYEVLVDSGADICIFDAELAELIGVIPEAGDQVFFSGVTGTGRVAYLHRIELIVGGQSLKTRVAFASLPSHAYGIVGQRGFFEHFRIIFDHQKQSVELRPKTAVSRPRKQAA